MALPIRQGEELIGALDIRSMRSKAFSFDNLEVFQVLASQIGIAIQNARLYEQNVQALKDTEDAYRRLAGSTWSGFVQQMDIKAFAYDGVSSRALADAPAQSKPVLLSVPVTVRGQVIGNLRLNPLDPNRTWSDDDIAIARAVAERAALALEAARLLEDAQKRASRESFLSEVASKLSTSFQLDSILRDTVEELGQTLQGSTVSFQLVDPSSLPPAENSNGHKKGAA
jgi:GAF domain-containing protein